jgi:hypothetical protein
MKKLVSIAGDALGIGLPESSQNTLVSLGALGHELLELLSLKNGFYAFESALHVLPLAARQGRVDILNWNSRKAWREEYDDMADGILFFAEDVFGNQFGINKGEVVFFDAETADVEHFSGNISQWAERIVAEYSLYTGFPLAHEWQLKNGPLPENYRLVPRVPFVCGGEYDVSNLFMIDSIKGMRTRGSIATQIRDLPDGTNIKFVITE